jgi:hypothetical protein
MVSMGIAWSGTKMSGLMFSFGPSVRRTAVGQTAKEVEVQAIRMKIRAQHFMVFPPFYRKRTIRNKAEAPSGFRK